MHQVLPHFRVLVVRQIVNDRAQLVCRLQVVRQADEVRITVSFRGYLKKSTHLLATFDLLLNRLNHAILVVFALLAIK